MAVSTMNIQFLIHTVIPLCRLL